MLEPIWNPFSSFADKHEKRVDKFLRRITVANIFESQRVLVDLMQKNMVIVMFLSTIKKINN